ncbi:unnamed protein product [Vitrella brassicaformis CCMP3155]|uniref:Uncharacterized protein n=1 Tax=Vitrella brassicaformis (strain CCMP3155) TaxID=1169540 RepID=A0A0G4F986_VITBC|nr:unnamed protein product [Vitrella brassicaformis CCMP3155]|eukprot:CEM08937.1 unnamed protein product [Vitrella brassicaformis CCMP3155]
MERNPQGRAGHVAREKGGPSQAREFSLGVREPLHRLPVRRKHRLSASWTCVRSKEGTRAVEEGLRHLQELNTTLGALRSHFEQAHPPSLSGQASAGLLELRVQHALVSSHIATAQSQLTRTHEDVSRVVDALKAILAAAPNPATQDDAEAPAVSRPSFRLVYRSGNSPPVNQKDR